MKGKPYQIRKQLVLDAYKEVRANKGAPGCDGMDFEQFERHQRTNLYKIWNRMSSGSYFPSPVLAVDIPKRNGKTRTLGIPTITDRVAQMAALKVIEPYIDPLFHKDSYGYRPHRSALDAVETARKRCWQFPYVIELDIKGLFDNIDHELLMRAVEKHVKEPWVVLYIRRWLTTPFVDQNGNLTPRTAGTPQGGVISPILANLFMHYAFDAWMEKHHPGNPFERYADDALIHCSTREEAERLKAALAKRFAGCRLEMNKEKTRIAYCKSETNRKDEEIVQFDFLGYTFTPVYLECRDGRRRLAFCARAGKRAYQNLNNRMKDLKPRLLATSQIEDVAKILNPVIRGWTNYFGRFQPTAMLPALRKVEERIQRWARRKHETLEGCLSKARNWLGRIRERIPDMFTHWKYLYDTAN